MAKKSRRKVPFGPMISALSFAAAVTAIVIEVRKPAGQRTWHGTVWGFVPYDFRPPNPERVRATLWAPDGPLVVPQVFGVGWSVNVGAIVTRLTRALQA